MTEATKRPWKRDKYGYMTADGENLYVAHGVTVPNSESHPKYAEALANEELIFKAVNNHDVLIEALETALNTETAARIGSESGAMQGFDYKYHYAKIRTALEAAK